MAEWLCVEGDVAERLKPFLVDNLLEFLGPLRLGQLRLLRSGRVDLYGRGTAEVGGICGWSSVEFPFRGEDERGGFLDGKSAWCGLTKDVGLVLLGVRGLRDEFGEGKFGLGFCRFLGGLVC